MNTTSPPLVTVVTVCFNLLKNKRGSCFDQCLRSVQQQDYPCIEHLVIDGASTDGTVDMLQEYERQGIIRLISEPDSGIYEAMNKGIRHARGKYVVFLNSDDFWHDAKAVSASAAALERSGAAFSYAPRTIVREDGSFYCTEAAALGVFPCQMPFCHQTMFTRRDILLRMNGFDAAQYRSAADYELILRILLGGHQGVYVPLNFTSFRLGGFSAGDALSRQECHMARCRLLGESAAKLLQAGSLDDDLWNLLSEKVAAPVAVDLLRCFKDDGPGCYRLRYGLVRKETEESLPVAGGAASRCCAEWRLLGFLPILRCKIRPSRTDFLLLNWLPLLRVRRKRNRRQLFLFCFIPLLSCKVL